MQIMLLLVSLFFFIEVSSQRAGRRQGEGRINQNNTHLLLFRGSGKSFWKKVKDKEKKRDQVQENSDIYFHITQKKNILIQIGCLVDYPIDLKDAP